MIGELTCRCSILETREYPRLCWLAQVDMAKFLQVMSVALEDPERATTSPLNHQAIFHVLQDIILPQPSGSSDTAHANQFSVSHSSNIYYHSWQLK